MCNLTNFNFNNNQVRTLLINDKPYFVGCDVAKALGYSKPRNAISTHCKGALKQGILTDGGKQEMLVIPEGDVFRLIIKSRLEKAQKFESWVMDEVLPQLRKTGSYDLNQSKSTELKAASKQLNQINLNDFDNWQYFYMNDILLSFPYFRYKINQDTGLPLINIDDYVKCVGFRSYSLYLLEKDNKNKETIEFKKIYDITCNKLMKEYLEDFRERFKKASELKILEDLSNPCIVEDEREYNSTLYIEDYKNLIGTERLYTATEIGSVLGISSLMVGKIANKLKLKNEKFGAWFKDKASHSIKEVQTFKYNKNIIEELRKYLNTETKLIMA